MKKQKCSIKDFYKLCMGLTNQNATHPINWFNIFIESSTDKPIPHGLEQGVITNWNGKTVYCIYHPKFNGVVPKKYKTDKGYKGKFKADKSFKTSEMIFGKIAVPIKYIFICEV